MGSINVNCTYEKPYEKKYKTYDEKFTKAKAIYANEERYLFHDFKLTEPVKESELEDLIFSDVVIIYGDAYIDKAATYNLVSKQIDGGSGTTYLCVPETTPE